MNIFITILSVIVLSAKSYAQLSFDVALSHESASSSSLGKGLKVSDYLKSGAVTCNEEMGLKLADPSIKLGNFLSNNQQISKHTACFPNSGLNILKQDRFGMKNCEAAIACKKLWGSEKTDKDVNALLNEIVAKDYGKNVLQQNIEAMESLEKVKRFAFTKYKLLSQTCESRFSIKEANECRPELLANIFEDHQKVCSGGSLCFKRKGATPDAVESYSDFKRATKSSLNKSVVVGDFFINRVIAKTAENMAEDDVRMEKLASLVSSDHFKKASGEQKMDLFFDGIGINSLDKLNDPILGADFGSMLNRDQLRKTPKYKELLSILENKQLSKESFAGAFDNFRKKRAEEFIGKSDVCRNTKALDNLCAEVTGLADGKHLLRDAINAANVSSKEVDKDESYKKLQDIYGKDSDEVKLSMFIDAKRCSAFGLGSDRFSFSGMRPGQSDESSSMTRGYVEARSESSISGSKEDLISRYVGSAGNDYYKVVSEDMTVKASGSPKEDVVRVQENRDESLAGGFNSAMSTQAPTNYSSGAYDAYNTNQFNSSFIDSSVANSSKKNESSSDEESSSSQGSSAMNSKVNDLMQRLDAAEARVAKMKADNEEAENARVKQKKLDEENALIKGLKDQIADLKTQNAKRETAAAAPVERAQDAQRSLVSNPNTNYISSSGSGSQRAETASTGNKVSSGENYDSGRISQPSSQASQAPVRSIASVSGAVLTATSSNEGGKTTTLASGIVLTTIDGLTTEKASQTISNRIMELNGAPFYIEEGGLVKEILPVIKDGKVLLDEKGNPIYEKIVKGKVGDKKFALKAKKDREPASITTPADLKRDQEEALKRERAEYLKLKDLTNGVIKGK